MNWLETAGMPDGTKKRVADLQINNIRGRSRQRWTRGAGVAMLPDYVVDKNAGPRPIDAGSRRTVLRYLFLLPTSDEKIRQGSTLYRDFLLSKARGWSF